MATLRRATDHAITYLASGRDLLRNATRMPSREGGRGDALRRAQIEMLGRPDRAHPYYWASFIVSGDDGPLDESA